MSPRHLRQTWSDSQRVHHFLLFSCWAASIAPPTPHPTLHRSGAIRVDEFCASWTMQTDCPRVGDNCSFLFVSYFVPWNLGMTFKWKRFFGTHEWICALSHTSETKMAPRVPPPHICPPPATHFFYPLWLWSIPQQLLHHTSFKK